MKVRITGAGFGALVLTAAAACAPALASARAPSSPPPPTEPALSPAEIAAAFPPADDTSRIIPVNGDLAEVVYTLGLGDRIVATDLSASYPPEALDTPKVGYQRTLNAETILTFEPTLVLADDRAGPPEVFDTLRSAGVEVVIVEHHNDLRAPAYKVRAVASTLGVPEAGEAVVAAYEADLAEGTEIAAAGVAAGGRPLVLALYLRGDRVQYAFGRGSGIDAVIAAAGGTDAGTLLGVDDYAELSTESVIELGPEFLLVTTTGLESIGGLGALLEIPGLAQTPAGADPDHRVLQFEDQFLYGLGPRTGRLVADLAAALHPTISSPTTT